MVMKTIGNHTIPGTDMYIIHGSITNTGSGRILWDDQHTSMLMDALFNLGVQHADSIPALIASPGKLANIIAGELYDTFGFRVDDVSILVRLLHLVFVLKDVQEDPARSYAKYTPDEQIDQLQQLLATARGRGYQPNCDGIIEWLKPAMFLKHTAPTKTLLPAPNITSSTSSASHRATQNDKDTKNAPAPAQRDLMVELLRTCTQPMDSPTLTTILTELSTKADDTCKEFKIIRRLLSGIEDVLLETHLRNVDVEGDVKAMMEDIQTLKGCSHSDIN